jgi:hypothetical protein
MSLVVAARTTPAIQRPKADRSLIMPADKPVPDLADARNREIKIYVIFATRTAITVKRPKMKRAVVSPADEVMLDLGNRSQAVMVHGCLKDAIQRPQLDRVIDIPTNEPLPGPKHPDGADILIAARAMVTVERPEPDPALAAPADQPFFDCKDALENEHQTWAVIDACPRTIKQPETESAVRTPTDEPVADRKHT